MGREPRPTGGECREGLWTGCVQRKTSKMESPKLKRRKRVVQGEVENSQLPQSWIHVSLRAEEEADEIGQILVIWDMAFGQRLKAKKVREHLAELRKWQRSWAR